MTPTIERLRSILVKDYKLAPEALTPDAPLEALGLDSLGVAELLFNVEDEFKIRLPPEPVPLATLGDVVHFIDALVAAQAGGGAAAPPAIVAVAPPAIVAAAPPAIVAAARPASVAADVAAVTSPPAGPRTP